MDFLIKWYPGYDMYVNKLKTCCGFDKMISWPWNVCKQIEDKLYGFLDKMISYLWKVCNSNTHFFFHDKKKYSGYEMHVFPQKRHVVDLSI